jgi:hypothetical protein
MKRVRQLVFESVQSIDSALSPSLILIFNKCDLNEEFDIDKSTANFFANPENEDLRRFYNDVRAVCVPHQDSVKKIKAPGKPALLIDGEEIFQLQMKKLATLIKSMLSERISLRERKGNLYSEYVWCYLFKW